MYGVQLDQLAALLALTERRARAVGARWRARGYADTARLGPGAPWLWLTRAGLAACGPLTPPPRRPCPGWPISARSLRSGLPSSRRAPTERLPRTGAANGTCEPASARSAPASTSPTARCTGQIPRTCPTRVNAGRSRPNSRPRPPAAPSRSCCELLTRTGDYGCAAAERLRPTAPPLHARVLYLCSSAARPGWCGARSAGHSIGRGVRGRGSRCGASRQAPSWSMRPASRAGQPAAGRPCDQVLPHLAGAPGGGPDAAGDGQGGGGRRRSLAAAPATVVAAYAYVLAWLLGWPPDGCTAPPRGALPMVGVFFAAQALRTRQWGEIWRAPFGAWRQMWRLAASGSAGSIASGLAAAAPIAIPAGLLIGGLAWSYRIFAMETGTGGLSATAPITFDLRQWRHQVRAARARIAAPGAVPLLGRGGDIVVGAVIRTVQHPVRAVARVPVPAAALPSGRDRHHWDGQDDATAQVMGGIRRRGVAALRGRLRRPPAARGPGLQGRRRLAAGGRPRPPRAAVGGRSGDRDLAGRSQPFAVALTA